MCGGELIVFGYHSGSSAHEPRKENVEGYIQLKTVGAGAVSSAHDAV